MPIREEFALRLRGKEISKGEHRRVHWAWDHFRCKNLSDYTAVYCEFNVLLLASIFKTFRAQCFQPQGYRLDPAHFVTALLLSFSAMLLKNLLVGVEIKNISEANVDINDFMMVEKGIHGGICQVLHPYA